MPRYFAGSQSFLEMGGLQVRIAARLDVLLWSLGEVCRGTFCAFSTSKL